MSNPEERLEQWLRDAHAAERQAETKLTSKAGRLAFAKASCAKTKPRRSGWSEAAHGHTAISPPRTGRRSGKALLLGELKT